MSPSNPTFLQIGSSISSRFLAYSYNCLPNHVANKYFHNFGNHQCRLHCLRFWSRRTSRPLCRFSLLQYYLFPNFDIFLFTFKDFFSFFPTHTYTQKYTRCLHAQEFLSTHHLHTGILLYTFSFYIQVDTDLEHFVWYPHTTGQMTQCQIGSSDDRDEKYRHNAPCKKKSMGPYAGILGLLHRTLCISHQMNLSWILNSTIILVMPMKVAKSISRTNKKWKR